MSIKRRVEKLELHKENKDLGIILLEEIEDNLYIRWNSETSTTYKKADILELEKHNQVLIIKWV